MRILFFLVFFFNIHTCFAETQKLKVVASFSVIADMINQIAGDKVDLFTIVGANTDAHIYEPKPHDLKSLKEADLLILNGFGFESWIEKLIESSGFKGKKIIASNGISPLFFNVKNTSQKIPDPHCWHSLPNGKHYVTNIMNALKEIDAQHAAFYEQNGKAYLQKLDDLDRELKDTVKEIPESKRVVITSHDAFEYLGKEYGIKFISPLGVSTEAEPSSKEIAEIVRRIKKDNIKAVFAEATTDRRLVETIACESGITIGGELYSDALSGTKDCGDTYISMVRSNLLSLKAALSIQNDKENSKNGQKGCTIQ